jgi:hypothetical protein
MMTMVHVERWTERDDDDDDDFILKLNNFMGINHKRLQV